MPEQKEIPSKGINLSSITGVLNTLLTAFSAPEPPIQPLPPPLIMIGAKLRVGLSAEEIAANIISEQSDAGRKSGDIFADGPNVEEAMEVIRMKALITALLTQAKVEIVIPPGVSVLTVGVGNLGAPVVSQGITVSMGIGDGVIR